MNNFKLKIKRQKKRHEKQQWAKKVKEEIEGEKDSDLQIPAFRSDQKLS